jgi:hypothetical protein
MSGRTPSDCKACRTGGPHDDLPWARGDDRTDRRRGVAVRRLRRRLPLRSRKESERPVAGRSPVGTAPRHRLPALEQRDRGDGRARARPRRRLGCVRKAGELLPRAGAPRRLGALPEHTTTAPPCRSPSGLGPPTPDRWRSDAVRADADTPSTAWTRPRRGTCTYRDRHRCRRLCRPWWDSPAGSGMAARRCCLSAASAGRITNPAAASNCSVEPASERRIVAHTSASRRRQARLTGPFLCCTRGSSSWTLCDLRLLALILTVPQGTERIRPHEAIHLFRRRCGRRRQQPGRLPLEKPQRPAAALVLRLSSTLDLRSADSCPPQKRSEPRTPR